jgi:hypothetical protein
MCAAAVAMGGGQPPLNAVVGDREVRVVDAEQVERRCMEVVAGGRVLGRLEAKFIAAGSVVLRDLCGLP